MSDWDEKIATPFTDMLKKERKNTNTRVHGRSSWNPLGKLFFFSLCVQSKLFFNSKNGKAEVITDEDGFRMIPTCVAFLENETLYGTQAALSKVRNPESTVDNFLYLLFAKAKERQSLVGRNRWKLEDNEGKPCAAFEHGGKDCYFSIEQVLKTFLKGLKKTIEGVIGSSIVGAVLSVPSFFGKDEMVLLSELATESGIPILTVMNDFECALNAYPLESLSKRKVLCLQMGATFTGMQLVDIKEGVAFVTAKSSIMVGGADFNEELLKVLSEEFKKKFKTDLKKGNRGYLKLEVAAEQTKKSLSMAQTASCYVESIHEGMDFSMSVTKTRLEAALNSKFNSVMAQINDFLSQNGIEAASIEDVLLLGGCAKVPLIQNNLKASFPSVWIETDPDEVYAKGASIQATILMSYPDYPAEITSVACLSSSIHASFLNEKILLAAKDSILPLEKEVSLPNHPQEFELKIIEEEKDIAVMKIKCSNEKASLRLCITETSAFIEVLIGEECSKFDLTRIN